MRHSGMFFFNRDPREAARKNQFDSSLPLPVEWEWDGMREETGNEYVTIS